jgi:hypothetical protein
MYSYAKKYEKNKHDLYQKLYNDKNQSKKMNQNYSDGNLIFEKMKEEAFKKIFNDLDGDNDNLITVHNIAIKNVSHAIMKIIDPLIIELKEENETLTEIEFIRAMNQLFEVIYYPNK